MNVQVKTLLLTVVAFLLCNPPAIAAGPAALPLQASDLRQAAILKTPAADVELADGFTAMKDGNSIVVHVPGAYLDKCPSSMATPLTLQVAAAAYLKIAKSDAKTAADVTGKLFIVSKEGKTGSGDPMTFHYFKLAKGRFAKIFVYLNEMSGVTAVCEIVGAAPGK